MGGFVGQIFCAFASTASSSRFRIAIAVEWKTLRTRSDVNSPSGRSHIAGAVSSWEVSRVTLSGLRRFVRRDAAVDKSLDRLSVIFARERSWSGTLVYPADRYMSEGNVVVSRAVYLQAYFFAMLILSLWCCHAWHL